MVQTSVNNSFSFCNNHSLQTFGLERAIKAKPVQFVHDSTQEALKAIQGLSLNIEICLSHKLIISLLLSSYNNSILYGAWFNAAQPVEGILEQINQLLAKSPIEGSEEFALHDYEGFY